MNDIRDELDELIADRKILEEQQDQREQIERRLAQIDDDAEREATIEELQDERETLTDTIETLETEVEQQDRGDYSELLDLHKEAN